MKKALVGVLVLLSTWASWADKDLKYSAFEEWEKLGLVRNFQDTSDTSVSVIADCDSVEFGRNAVKIFMYLGWVIDKNNEAGGIVQVSTDWKTKSVDGMSSFFTGYDQVRTRIVTTAVPDGAWSKIDVQIQAEGSRDGGAWRNISDRELRNSCREVLVSLLAKPIYGDSPGVREVLFNSKHYDRPLPSKEEFTREYHVHSRMPQPPAPAASQSPQPENPPVLK